MPVETLTPERAYAPIKAPRGNQMTCKGWHQEAAMRMLMNNLDEEVGERPRDLVVYGGTGRAARNWECYHAILASLKALANDETLLVQSGKPVGVFKTHEYAPRVLIANANLVGHWSNWEQFNRLERAGLMMYGQMTAGSWIYIGSQGIVQGTFETFAAAGEKHFGGDLAGKLIVSGGMGGMGGAQPLAATMTGAAFLGIDVDPERIKKRLKTGYCDFMVTTLDEALRILKNAVRKKENISGEASDIHLTDDLVLELFPDNRILRRWIDLARKRIKFQGLPARICWLGYGERAQFGLAMNDLVKKGKLKAPIVMGRDHLDCGSVASPFRETESMKDGSDAVADWPLLNALLNTAAGASWVSIHNGGGVGIGYSVHAGQVTVADGTEDMAKRIERVLTTDPGMGIVRHADASYDNAKEFAKNNGVKVPMG